MKIDRLTDQVDGLPWVVECPGYIANKHGDTVLDCHYAGSEAEEAAIVSLIIHMLEVMPLYSKLMGRLNGHGVSLADLSLEDCDAFNVLLDKINKLEAE